jgi:hypothetical protein
MERAGERGSNEDEIRAVIDTGFWIPAKKCRLGRARIYDFKQRRLGRYYEEKRA